MSLQKTIDSMQTPRKRVETRRYEVQPKPRNKVDCRQNAVACESPCNARNNKANSFCPILVTDQQGLVEIHISSLQLSSFTINHLFGDFRMNPALFISCDFCGQGSLFSPTQRYPSLTFNASCAYRVPRLSKFLNCLLHDNMYFQVHIVQPGGRPSVVAEGKLSVKDILDYPQNKLHYIANLECIIPCYRNANFGQIFFWIRLSCDIELIRAFKRESMITARYPENGNDIFGMKERGARSRKQSTEKSNHSERRSNRSRQLSDKRSPQMPSSAASSETEDMLRNFSRRETHFESTPKSLQSFPTTSASERIDPLVKYQESKGDKKRGDSWRAWSLGDHPVKRDEIREAIQKNQEANGFIDTENLFDDTGSGVAENWGRYKRKSLNSQASGGGDAVVIRIERLNLLPGTDLLNNPDVHQLYVEFSFLGNYGLDLETTAVPIPKKPPFHLYFNYMKRFDVDEKFNSDQRRKLGEMLSDEVSSSIKFTIVNEPLMEEMQTKDCTEVGHAHLNLKQHVLRGGHHDISLIVSNADGNTPIGALKITLLGADVIRNCIPAN